MTYYIQSNSGQFIDPTNQPSTGACIAIVTPAMARHWLDRCNVDNRKIRKTQVRRLEYAIANGSYRENVSTIAFSLDGRLLNGQHTLMAVCNSGTDVSLTIQYGMPAESFDAYDTGAPRSLTDVTKLGSFEVSIINVLHQAIHRSTMPDRISPIMLKKFYWSFDDAFREMTLINSYKSILKPAMIPAAFVASYYVEMNNREWHKSILRWMANDVEIVQEMKMPKVVNAWNASMNRTKLVRNGGTNARHHFFLKAMRVFDLESANHNKILELPSDNFREKLRQYVGI